MHDARVSDERIAHSLRTGNDMGTIDPGRWYEGDSWGGRMVIAELATERDQPWMDTPNY